MPATLFAAVRFLVLKDYFMIKVRKTEKKFSETIKDYLVSRINLNT